MTTPARSDVHTDRPGTVALVSAALALLLMLWAAVAHDARCVERAGTDTAAVDACAELRR